MPMLSEKLKAKRTLYWTEVEAALVEAGFVFGTDEWRKLVQGECEKCNVFLIIEDQRTQAGFRDLLTGNVALKASTADGAWKHFPELKRGGFNYTRLVAHVRDELVEKHRMHLQRDERRASRETAQATLHEAVGFLGLPDLWDHNYRGEATGVYGYGLAKPTDRGTVRFLIEVRPAQVESVLRFLDGRGLVPKEAPEAE